MMCGAKPGDYFTLEGEMMYLPPDQGISIYSLGESEQLSACWIVAEYLNSIHTPTTRCEAETDTSKRLDDDRCCDSVPGSKLQVDVEDHKDEAAHISTFGDNSREAGVRIQALPGAYSAYYM